MTTPSFNTRQTIDRSLHPEEPRSGVTKGEGAVRAAILRDAMLRIAPQDEDGLIGVRSLHPEEPRSGVTKGGAAMRDGEVLRDASLRAAPQDEEPLLPEEPRSGVTKGGRGCASVLRDAGLRPAPQDEGRHSW